MSKTIVEVSSEDTKRRKDAPEILSYDKPLTSKSRQVLTSRTLVVRNSENIVNERVNEKNGGVPYQECQRRRRIEVASGRERVNKAV